MFKRQARDLRGMTPTSRAFWWHGLKKTTWRRQLAGLKNMNFQPGWSDMVTKSCFDLKISFAFCKNSRIISENFYWWDDQISGPSASGTDGRGAYTEVHGVVFWSSIKSRKWPNMTKQTQNHQGRQSRDHQIKGTASTIFGELRVDAVRNSRDLVLRQPKCLVFI